MRLAFSILFVIFLSIPGFSQIKYQVMGKITDSFAKNSLSQTSIAILNASDSILVKFGWTDLNGNFRIDNLKNGKFILLVSYPEYADFLQRFTLDSTNSSFDFGEINLTSKARLLNEVIISGKIAAIKMKGDTTEFNARAFVIQPNAKVEDLLKQLPGIQVDNNGRITAHGQIIKKVLVEGEEFFGDDPTLVTRNLRGDMIDKVQLYDKMSDQSTFTGVDDGKKEKIINLKLKEDKKKGYFGKLETGAGTSGFYQSQAMANLFKEKQKMAVYGNSGNTGKTGLSSSENTRYGTDGGTIEFLSGGITLTGSNADEIETNSGRYTGQGIPLSNTSGLHYDGRWNNNKESINANFKIGSLQIDGERQTITQNDLPSGIILNNQQQVFSNYNFRQRLDVAYQINFNSNSSLKIKIDGINKQSETENSYLASSLNEKLTLLNQTDRRLTNTGDQQVLNMSAFFSRKLKKAGRTWSLNLTEALSKDNSTGFLNSQNQFYDRNENPIGIQVIDQYKTNEKSLAAFNSNLTFTEPFSKSFSLLLNYRFGIIKSIAFRNSFNLSPDQTYTLLDKEFSNDIVLDQISNQTGGVFTYLKGKQRVQFGSKVAVVNVYQLDRYTSIKYDRNFVNFVPEMSYQYRHSAQTQLLFNYVGSTIQPSFDQIQPLKVNTDPLNLIIGNPELAPSFRHSIVFSYNSYKPISGFSTNLIASYGIVQNPITNVVNTDFVGRSTLQSINLKSNNLTEKVLRGTIGKQLKTITSFISLSFFYNSMNNFGTINEVLNKRKNNVFTSSIYFSKNKSKKYDFDLSFGPRIVTGSSSIQSQLKNNGYGYEGNLTLNLYLPRKLELRTSSNFNYQSETESFNEEYQASIINASIAKKFLKEENLKFSISANDILNQNVGFNRNAYGTMITQSSYTNIARYFMFSVTWDFSKFGKTSTN